MRHVGGQGTIGRATPATAPIQEEVVYEVEQPIGRNGSSHSGGSETVYAHKVNGHSSSTTLTNVKTELPPVPPNQAPVANNVNKALPTPVQRESSTYSEDEGTVRRMIERRDPSYGSDDSEELRQDLERAQLSSPLPPTMLDSVVLPAIASVSSCRLTRLFSYFLL